ncbi:uncharacterized protein LOC144439424 [Glandiceps talaboti]
MCKRCRVACINVASLAEVCTSTHDRKCGPCIDGYFKDFNGNCEPCKYYPPNVDPACAVHLTTEKTTTKSPTMKIISSSTSKGLEGKQTEDVITHNAIGISTSRGHTRKISLPMKAGNQTRIVIESNEDNFQEKESKEAKETILSTGLGLAIGGGGLYTVFVAIFFIVRKFRSNASYKCKTISATLGSTVPSVSSLSESNDGHIEVNVNDRKVIYTIHGPEENKKQENEKKSRNVSEGECDNRKISGDQDKERGTSMNMHSYQGAEVVNEVQENKSVKQLNKKKQSTMCSLRPDKLLRSRSHDESTENDPLLKSMYEKKSEQPCERDGLAEVHDHSQSGTKGVQEDIPEEHKNSMNGCKVTTESDMLGPNNASSYREASVNSAVPGKSCKESNSNNLPGTHTTQEEQERREGKVKKADQQMERKRAMENARGKPLGDLLNDRDMKDDLIASLTPPSPYENFQKTPIAFFPDLVAVLGIHKFNKYKNTFRGPEHVLEYMNTSLPGNRDIAMLLEKLEMIDRFDIIDDISIWVSNKYCSETQFPPALTLNP